MPGFLLHVGATMTCPHVGQVTTVSTNTRVMVSGQPVATINDTFTIVGCTFTVGSKPQPCVKIQWIQPATRVQVEGQSVLLLTSTGLCQSAEQVPQGPPTPVVVQSYVGGI